MFPGRWVTDIRGCASTSEALTPSTKPDEPDAGSKESLSYAIFEATSGVGFV
jgi:hypothetical protein